jgi:hypothetical protein
VNWPRSLQIIRATRAKTAAPSAKKQGFRTTVKCRAEAFFFLQAGFACITRFRHPPLCVLPNGALVVCLNTMVSKESAKNWTVWG